VSNNESFIEEVTEEVRRDRLFALMRKYGWIAVLAVLLLVGGAAYNEWRKATDIAAAQDLGDRLMAALDQEDRAQTVAALKDIGAASEGGAKAIAGLLLAGEAQTGGDSDSAAAVLQAVAGDAGLPQSYRDLAAMKLVLLKGKAMPAGERQSILEGLARPGTTLRLLAEEQLALIDVENGDKSAAISRLEAIIADVEVTRGLRSRASLMIVALGGEIEAS
jgi:hypothetical protein